MSTGILFLLAIFSFLIYRILKDLAMIWMYSRIIRSDNRNAETQNNNRTLLQIVNKTDGTKS